ncbi:MAG TPA: SOS response-associated peptidase [Pyrinomonadaceae bacterium]|jgi:putative SOS response-associated peptidase YedK
MCGRFTQRQPVAKLRKEFGVEEVLEVEACYNIAPTQDVLGVHESPDGRQMTFYKWGLIPSWAKDASMGARLINARSETVTEKPAFRQAFKQRRCIIPADGFYEWQRTEGRKQPFFCRMRDESPFGFAGLWERWEGDGAQVINSCTILTTEANEVLRPVHGRMPVILHLEDYELWLDTDVRKLDLVKEAMKPYPPREMIGYAVGISINSPRSQGAQLIERAAVNSA